MVANSREPAKGNDPRTIGMMTPITPSGRERAGWEVGAGRFAIRGVDPGPAILSTGAEA